MLSVASRLLVQAPRLQVCCVTGAVPLQPEPLVPAVVSWHHTNRVSAPVEHEAEQLLQAPVCQLKQFGLAHEVDSGAQPPHTDSAAAAEPSE